jgi:hypothetical protein
MSCKNIIVREIEPHIVEICAPCVGSGGGGSLPPGSDFGEILYWDGNGWIPLPPENGLWLENTPQGIRPVLKSKESGYGTRFRGNDGQRFFDTTIEKSSASTNLKMSADSSASVTKIRAGLNTYPYIYWVTGYGDDKIEIYIAPPGGTGEKIEINKTKKTISYNGLEWAAKKIDLLDDESVTVCPAGSGFGTVNIGDDEEFSQFRFSASGVTLINATANVASADIDRNLCIFVTGGNLVIKNRLGSQKTTRYDCKY